MRRIGTVLWMVVSAACSSAPAVQPETVEKTSPPAHGTSRTGGTIQLKGMPVMEAAVLEHWQGAANVTEGVDGAADTLELAISALADNGKVEASIHVSKLVEAQGGMAISGDYQLAEMGMNGQRHQVNVMADGVIYRSISGRVTFNHAAGKIRGSFEAQVVRDGDSQATPIALTGTFEGWMGLSCHALQPSTPDPDAKGGVAEMNGQPSSSPSWVLVGATHEFCRKYL